MNFRERFEHWHLKKYGYKSSGKGTALNYKYDQPLIQQRWEGWQAKADDDNQVLINERDEWVAKHKECTRLLGEAMQDRADMAVERDAYAAAADSMAASHKVERDALKAAARLALDVMDDLSGIGMSEVECLSVLLAIAALRAVL